VTARVSRRSAIAIRLRIPAPDASRVIASERQKLPVRYGHDVLAVLAVDRNSGAIRIARLTSADGARHLDGAEPLNVWRNAAVHPRRNVTLHPAPPFSAPGRWRLADRRQNRPSYAAYRTHRAR